MGFLKRLGLPLSMSVLMIGCGSQSTESDVKIFGGVPTTGSLFGSSIENATVSLGGTRSFCTGTLIGPRLVVTAAHCLRGQRQGRVNIGFTESGRIARTVRSSGHAIHELFGDPDPEVGQRFDIGIVVLAQNAPANHPPVNIYTGAFEIGQKLVLAGYGRTELGRSGRLLFTENPIQVTEIADDEFLYDYNDTFSGACNGDSGGPAYVVRENGDLEVIGATSRGEAGCFGFAIYTNVNFFSDWIATNASRLGL